MANIITPREADVLIRCVPADVKARLLQAAHKKCPGELLPVHGETTVDGGFRVDKNQYQLWFNDNINSTRIVHEDIQLTQEA